MNQIPEKLTNEINKLLLKKLSVKATSEYIESLLEGSSIKTMLLENGVSDTYEREMFFDLLSEKLIGQNWPTYSDSDEVSNKFTKDLVAAIEEQDGLFFVD